MANPETTDDRAEIVAANNEWRTKCQSQQAEIERLRAALTLQASLFVLKAPEEKEINWERVMREVNRRQRLAKEALR